MPDKQKRLCVWLRIGTEPVAHLFRLSGGRSFCGRHEAFNVTRQWVSMPPPQICSECVLELNTLTLQGD